ncbi:MAG: NUDIX domain-containing protein [Mariprofundales bacterium]|nr:NUDIX domain-containing protein [Mariprofundales bacterium]
MSLVFLSNKKREILLLQRQPSAHCGGFWSLPGGKQEPGEDAIHCAKRELAEETGIIANGWHCSLQWKYDYPDRSLHFTLFHAQYHNHAPLHCESAWRWANPNHLRPEELPPANRKIIPYFEEILCAAPDQPASQLGTLCP